MVAVVVVGVLRLTLVVVAVTPAKGVDVLATRLAAVIVAGLSPFASDMVRATYKRLARSNLCSIEATIRSCRASSRHKSTTT